MSSHRKYLVFARVGRASLHRGWLEGDQPRNWDLQLSQYDDDPSIGEGGDLPLSVDKGTKWDSCYRYLAAHPEIMSRYRYIMFMDDDLVITRDAINRVFEISDEHELLVAQPALHPSSYFCYPILLQCPLTKLRYTNFVECMAAAIRTDYLEEFMPYMANVTTGWGMDMIWTVAMREPSFRSAIIDEVSVVHTRPHATGGIYDEFISKEASPQLELQRTLNAYEDVPDKMMTYGAILPNGARINGVVARLINGAYLAAASPRFRDRMSAVKSGAGMLVRAVTQAGYRPAQIRMAKAESADL